MANVEQLDPLLQSLQALKPPGASKGKIAAITTLCVDNIQSESVIAQRLYRHFKRTPGTHKLGVLYVVDSVTRQWIEKARQSGQDLSGSAAADGTFANGVHKITELLPALIDDLITNAPPDHKAKVENLVQIWERGQTFPPKLLADLKKKLSDPAPAPFVKSSTPPGSPPKQFLASLGIAQPPSQVPAPPPPMAAPPASTQQDATSILAALASLQPMPAAPQPPQQAAASAPARDLTALFAGANKPYQAPAAAQPQQGYPMPYGQPQQYNAPMSVPPPTQMSMPLPMPQTYPLVYQAPTPVQQAPQPPPQNPLGALASLLPPHILSNPEQLAQVIQLFQGLAAQGIPQDQWAPVLAALYPSQQQQQTTAGATSDWVANQDTYQSRDAYGGRRDRSLDRGRRRSRSPDYRRDNNNRRGSPVYGTYDASAANSSSDAPPPHQSDRRGKKGGRNYRQRTPPTTRNGRPDSPSGIPQGLNPKWTDMDPSIPPGHIKVLSRTLFVGGANGNEQELRAIFGRWGQVQTCIANEDKRHAFVKMCTRNDAVTAKLAMETMKDQDVLSKARQTKWGVGFGPRECCDYTTGISVIPIDTLTEADHKWILTAEYGGTGGRPIESGLVVEEPDIEIGAGVSSKAMSRRVGPENGGGSGGGGRRGRGGGGGGGGGRFRQPERNRESPRPDPVTIPPPPPVPGFGFNFAMPGMPPY